MTLDEWVAKNALGLGIDLSVHLSEYVPGEEREPLLRLLLISIRQWAENRDAEAEAESDCESAYYEATKRLGW